MHWNDRSPPTWADIEVRDLKRDHQRMVAEIDEITARMNEVATKVDEHGESLQVIQTQIEMIGTWGGRAILLIGLWAVALFANATAEDKAKLLAMLLSHAAGK